jgi:hypothetical protein
MFGESKKKFNVDKNYKKKKWFLDVILGVFIFKKSFKFLR